MEREISHIPGRRVRPLHLAAVQVAAALPDLPALGINISDRMLDQMVAGAMDAVEPTITTGSISTPVQFLQSWLPGFVRVITAARKIDELVGITTSGSWEDEEVVQGVMELTGTSVPYGDFTNVPFSSWNANFERRTIVRFEEGMRVGKLEEARAAKIRVDSAGSKREAAAVALEIQRNAIGFFGYNSGLGRTYGFLNDPSLAAYTNLPTGGWATATFVQITSDITSMVAALRNQSKDQIAPDSVDMTLAISTNVADYLSTVNTLGNMSVRDWLTKTYPRIRVVSAPELNLANGGANVVYLYAESVSDASTDDGRTFGQVVPTKFQVLGVEQGAKGYVEDYSNATAGIICKRPYAVVRRSGS